MARTIQEIAAVIQQVQYADWVFFIGVDGDRYYLQIHKPDPDGWRGRKWPLSFHMTNNELVQTCWLAVQTAQEHETRQTFQYRGQKVFGPYFNWDQVVDLMEDGTLIEERRKHT